MQGRYPAAPVLAAPLLQPAAACPLGLRRLPGPGRLRQLALKRQAGIAEPALEFRGLAPEVSEALAVRAAETEVCSHFLIPRVWLGQACPAGADRPHLPAGQSSMGSLWRTARAAAGGAGAARPGPSCSRRAAAGCGPQTGAPARAALLLTGHARSRRSRRRPHDRPAGARRAESAEDPWADQQRE